MPERPTQLPSADRVHLKMAMLSPAYTIAAPTAEAPMTANLKIEESTHDGYDVIDVTGEIDLATAPELESTLAEHVGPNKTIVDLSSVSFIDSTGLRVLLTIHEAAETAGGQLVLISAEGPVTRLFAITGVRDLLHIATNRDAAVAHA